MPRYFFNVHDGRDYPDDWNPENLSDKRFMYWDVVAMRDAVTK